MTILFVLCQCWSGILGREMNGLVSGRVESPGDCRIHALFYMLHVALWRA